MFLVQSDSVRERIRKLALLFAIAAVAAFIGGYSSNANAAHMSDMNSDGSIDVVDVELFSQAKYGKSYTEVDWCTTLRLKKKKNNIRKEIRGLFEVIDEISNCDCSILPESKNPHRMTLGEDHNLYVTDRKACSIFVYDPSRFLLRDIRVGERLLGIVTDPAGNIYVGNYTQHNIQVYDSTGRFVRSFGDGIVRTPNDLAFDVDGNLYVADGAYRRVLVFEPGGTLLRTLGTAGKGNGRMVHPVSLAIGYTSDGEDGEITEVYVADQGQAKIHVFNAEGPLLRAYGEKAEQGFFGYDLEGKFGQLKALQLDASGFLHALDGQMAEIQVLNPANGAWIRTYGTRGYNTGELMVPVDIVIDATLQMSVADPNRQRIERIPIP